MSHLTLTNRVEIERGLRENQSFNEIARHLGVSRSTVLREVRKHLQGSDKGAKGRVPNRCIHRSTCDRHFLCASCNKPHQDRKCSACGHCNAVCPDFKEIVCRKLQRPPYVCNGCPEEWKCVLHKMFYIADAAQKAYSALLVSAREGAAVTDEERTEMTDTLADALGKHQSIHHAMAANPDIFHVSERTLYTYVRNGVLKPVCLSDLPVAPKLKPRRRKGIEHKVDRECRKGRTPEDFKAYMEAHPDTPVVEMDSVEGKKGGKVLLTINFDNCTFMMLFIRDPNTSQSVIDVFNMLEDKLGLETFRRLFQVVLTDNGSEFSNPAVLEASHVTGERRTRIFYCRPLAAWQKPNVENNHKNLRSIFPKGESMDHVTPDKATLAMSHLNSKLREGLNDVPAFKLFATLYGEEILGSLGVTLIPAKEVNLSPGLVK